MPSVLLASIQITNMLKMAWRSKDFGEMMKIQPVISTTTLRYRVT